MRREASRGIRGEESGTGRVYKGWVKKERGMLSDKNLNKYERLLE